MKKIIRHRFGTLLGVLLSGTTLIGCTPFEQPTNVRDLDYVFSRGEETRQWLTRAYAFLPDPFVCWRSTWNEYFPYIAMSDECDMGLDGDSFNAYRIDLGDWNPNEDVYGGKWNILFKQIRHLYIFLDNVKVVANQNYIDSQDKVDAMKLEARFLIAYYHVRLFEQYGPIPIIRGAVDPSADVSELMVSRNSVDEVVDWLDRELYDIAQGLPLTEPDPRWAGRPLRGAALAVRARLLLLAASPLYNSPDGYRGLEQFGVLQNKDGKRLFPQNYDETKWKRAADAAKEVIDLNIYSLHETDSPTGDEKIDAFNSYREVFTKPGNKEVIFARTTTDYNEYYQGIQPRQWQAGGFMAVTQKLVDAFYMEDGKDIHDSGSYSEEGFTTDPDAITLNRYVLDLAKIDRVFNMYQHREPRFYVSVFFNGRKWESEHAEVNGVVEPCDFFLNGKSGRPNQDSPKTGYTTYKYVGVGDYKYQQSAKNPILFRLAEVYLNYIEALNHCDPGNEDILFYLNKIRDRAGIPDYEECYPDKLSQEDLHEAIMRERMVELNFEGNRYFDTRRYCLAEKENAGEFYGMNVQKTRNEETEFYKRTVFETRVFKKSFYLFPIPKEELSNNTNLVQNPYWN